MNKAQMTDAITPVLADIGCELWALEYRPNRDGCQIQIFLDKTDPTSRLTLEDCTQAGNLIRPILDVEFEMRGKYYLEISSPGIERKLYTTAQMLRYVGADVNVKLFAPKDNKKNFVGRLIAVDEDTLSIDLDGEVIDLSRDEIAKMNVVG